MKNAPTSSDPSKQPQVQIRNSSLVDKLKASNVIAQAAAAGNNAQGGNNQQKRLLVIKNKVVRADSLGANKQTVSTPNGQQP